MILPGCTCLSLKKKQQTKNKTPSILWFKSLIKSHDKGNNEGQRLLAKIKNFQRHKRRKEIRLKRLTVVPFSPFSANLAKSVFLRAEGPLEVSGMALLTFTRVLHLLGQRIMLMDSSQLYRDLGFALQKLKTSFSKLVPGCFSLTWQPTA